MLPKEILIHIFIHLDETDILNFKLCCKMTNDIANSVSIHGDRLIKKYNNRIFKKPFPRKGIEIYNDKILKEYLLKKHFRCLFFQKSIENIGNKYNKILPTSVKKYISVLFLNILTYYLFYWQSRKIHSIVEMSLQFKAFTDKWAEILDDESDDKIIELINLCPVFPILDVNFINNTMNTMIKILSCLTDKKRAHFNEIFSKIAKNFLFDEFSDALYFLGPPLRETYIDRKNFLFIYLYDILDYLGVQIIKCVSIQKTTDPFDKNNMLSKILKEIINKTL